MMRVSGIEDFAQMCGPAALSALTGWDRLRSAELLWRDARANGKRYTKSTGLDGIIRVLRASDYDCAWKFYRRYDGTRPTLASWLADPENREGTFIVRSGYHFIVVENGSVIEDNGAWQPRSRVTHRVRVTAPITSQSADDHAELALAATTPTSTTPSTKIETRKSDMNTTTIETPTTTTTSKTDTQFTTREVPWMKLGKIIDAEPKTATEAAELGGLNFTVSKRTAGWQDDAGEWHKSSLPRAAVVRDDTGEVFEYVSDDYRLLQYGEAFDFMDTISPRYVAAGALRGGRQGFVVVKPEIEIAPGGDKHEIFAVLRTSHDRSRAVEVMVMPLRDKCMNQLTLRSFAHGVKHRWSIPHTSTMEAKLKLAHESMAQLDEYSAAFTRLAERLMACRPEEATARQVLDKFIKNGGQNRDQVIDTIVSLWHSDEERVGYNDTAWGLVNATSEYFEWQKTRGTPESRFLQAIQGYHHVALNRVTQAMLQLAA